MALYEAPPQIEDFDWRWRKWVFGLWARVVKSPTFDGTVTITTLPVYANNAAAIAGGLVAGNLYRTGGNPDPVCVVH